jgi:hypothetical protein
MELTGASHSEQKERVGEDAKTGGGFNGLWVANLCLADSKQGLFITEVDFNLPTPKIGL